MSTFLGAPLTDVHIVGYEVVSLLASALERIGFVAKNVVGGDPRVRMPFLMSLKTTSAYEADRAMHRAVEAIHATGPFRGYIESEVTTTDEVIEPTSLLSEFCPATKPFIVSSCPPGVIKKADIHATAVELSPAIDNWLREVGFYFLRLDKPGIGPVSVYTVQTQDLQTGRRIWSDLRDDLRRCGQFRGQLRFEITRRVVSLGSNMPPIVLEAVGA